MKYIINEENWLSLAIANLETLKQVYEDEAMPTMIDDGNHDDRIDEIKQIIKYLNKTN